MSHLSQSCYSLAKVDSLLAFLMGAMPSVPAPNKWTTLYGPMDFCISGWITHGFLQQVFKNAFHDMTFAEFNQAESMSDADPRLVETLSFHAVNGKRLKSSTVFLETADVQWSLGLLGVAMEGNKMLTWYWLSCIGRSLKVGSRPSIYTLLDPRCSIVCHVLQYYACLLKTQRGEGRLLFLWKSCGYESFADFCAHEKDKVREIRRILLLEASWVFRRHFKYLNQDAFALTICGDDQAHPETLQNVLMHWDLKNHCCVQPGFCRELKRRGVTSEDLMTPKWRSFMYWTASTLQLSIADVESMHSQNRNHAGDAFSSMAAKFVNAESTRYMEEAKRLQDPESSEQSRGGRRRHVPMKSDLAGIKVEDRIGKDAKPKALSAIEIFRNHLLKRPGMNETATNPCSKEFWSMVRERFFDLSDEQRTLYEQMAADSKVSAQLARMQASASRQEAQPKPDAAIALPNQTKHQQPVLPVHSQVLPLSSLCQLVSQDGVQPVVNQVKQKVSQIVRPRTRTTAEEDQDDDPSNSLSAAVRANYPLSESSLENAYQAQTAKGLTSKDTFNAFKTEIESIARPSDDDVFPAKVIHEGWCGEQCRHLGTSIERILLHSNTLLLFQELVKKKGGVQGVIRSDVLCALA